MALVADSSDGTCGTTGPGLSTATRVHSNTSPPHTWCLRPHMSHARGGGPSAPRCCVCGCPTTLLPTRSRHRSNTEMPARSKATHIIILVIYKAAACTPTLTPCVARQTCQHSIKAQPPLGHNMYNLWPEAAATPSATKSCVSHNITSHDKNGCCLQGVVVLSLASLKSDPTGTAPLQERLQGKILQKPAFGVSCLKNSAGMHLLIAEMPRLPRLSSVVWCFGESRRGIRPKTRRTTCVCEHSTR